MQTVGNPSESRLLHQMQITPWHHQHGSRFWEPVKRAKQLIGVSSHSLEFEPLTHVKVRQRARVSDTVHGVTGWAPKTTGIDRLIRLCRSHSVHLDLRHQLKRDNVAE